MAEFAEPSPELSADDLLIDSDLAMYAAKEAGKDRYSVAAALDQPRLKTRITWTDRVKRALAQDGFELHCQPIVDLRTSAIAQWELLLRLPADNGELILPAQFLYTAERSGAILGIDQWVLREAIRLIAAHRDHGRELAVTVNISGRSVADPALPGFIETQLQDTEIDPASLVLEVTETAMIANMNHAVTFAAKLNELGCQLSLDDFGAGFGSFSYLKYIPFDFVKIDGEFIRQLPSSPTDQLILDSIVQMSRGLGKRTIAEFAGDQATVEILRDRGVDFAQGFHVGPPLPVSSALRPLICRATSASSGSTTSTAPKPSSGASTKKISIVMSGSTCACDRNASTLRSVSRSIVSVNWLCIMCWKSWRMSTTRSGWPLSMIVCSSGVKPLPRITTTMMSSSAYVLAFIGPRP